MDPNALDALADVGIVGLLLGVLIGGYRGWWIFGPVHRAIVADLVKDRDFYRTMAIGNLRLAERATDAVPASRPDAE